ncbi:MAG TPA: hypothetical protein VFB58_14735 [Chloroflexota bacterium]|nr:hypothetical protein [Chloroflexota bacterium]
MRCPVCQTEMLDATETWHTFSEAEGAEYLADYVTIWVCEACRTVAGVGEDQIEWIMEPESAAAE